MWQTGLSIHPPYFWRTAFVYILIDGTLLASYLLCQSFAFGWLILMERQVWTPAIPMCALGWKNCHAVGIWTYENSIWFIFIQRPLFSCRHAAFTLSACRDVKKHHCLWHIVRLDLTYFLPWPIIIPCLIILDRKPLECWPLCGNLGTQQITLFEIASKVNLQMNTVFLKVIERTWCFQTDLTQFWSFSTNSCNISCLLLQRYQRCSLQRPVEWTHDADLRSNFY